MEFEVEGVTFLNWKARVQADNESEAREEAQRIAGSIDVPSNQITLDAAQHFVKRSRAADSGG
jgi:hypothetical protein